MLAIATNEQQGPIPLRPSDAGERRVVDALPTRHQGSPRAASMSIVRSCVTYAQRVRYQQVTLSELSAAAGVSERRVRHAFSESFQVPPTVYLRIAALFQVRDVLIERPHARDAVTCAATDFGFWHLSRFAGQYRDLFGEMPSETVARARARDLQSCEAIA